MRTRSSILCWLTLVAVAGCAAPQNPPPPANVAEATPPAAGAPVEATRPVEPPLPTIPDSPAPAPASLFAVVGVADPSATLLDLGRYLDAANPGMAALASTELLDRALAEMFGVDIAGVDYGRPMWALVLDPAQAEAPVLVVVSVADRAAFDAAVEQGGALAVHHRGYAAIGSRPALEEASAHALSSVALGTAPANPTATVHVAAVMDRYGQQLDAMLPMLAGQLSANAGSAAASVQAILDGLVSLVRQTDRVTITLDASAELTIVAELVPRSGAAITELFDRQPVASFDAMSHYAETGILMGGKVDWDSLREYLKPFTDAALTESWGSSAGEMQELWSEMYTLMTGEMAFAMHLGAGGKTWVAGHWGVSDAKKVRAMTARFAKLAAKRPKDDPGPFTIKARAFKHKRVQVNGTSMTPKATAPRETREGFSAAFGDQPVESLFAVVDSAMVMSMGDGAEWRIRSAIDRRKAKTAPAPSEALEKALTLARAHHESLLSLIDVAAFTGASAGAEPIAIGLGFGEGRLSLRVTVPADQVRQIVQRASAAAPAMP